MIKEKNSIFGGGARQLLVGIGISVLCVIISAFCATAAAGATDDPTGIMSIYSLVALLVSGAVSGFLLSRLLEGGMGASMLSSLGTVILMLAVALFISGGTLSAGAAMNYLCYLGVALLSAFLGKKRGGKPRHRKR